LLQLSYPGDDSWTQRPDGPRISNLSMLPLGVSGTADMRDSLATRQRAERRAMESVVHALNLGHPTRWGVDPVLLSATSVGAMLTP